MAGEFAELARDNNCASPSGDGLFIATRLLILSTAGCHNAFQDFPVAKTMELFGGLRSGITPLYHRSVAIEKSA